MGDFAGALKLLGLVAVSLGVTALAWMTIQNGGLVFKSGKEQEPSQHVAVAIPQPDSNIPPLRNHPRSYQPPPIPEGQSGSGIIYKWVDGNGTLHFSDRFDQPAAQTVTVNPVAMFKSPDVQRPIVSPANFSPPNDRTQIRQVAFSSDDFISEIPADRLSRGIFQTRNGYHINTNAKHAGARLSFEGRVEGGPACGTLQLVGILVNNQGKRLGFSAYAQNVGSGSRLFASRERGVNWVKAGWEVEGVSVACKDP